MSEFEDRFKSPEIWFQQSWEMFESSKAIYALFLSIDVRSMKDNYRHVGLMKSTMMTLGFALENALKGAYVFKHEPKLENGRLEKNYFPGKAHDLELIAHSLNLKIEEIALFTRLSRFIQWSAKYKVPFNNKEFEESVGSIRLKETDFNVVESIIEELQLESGFSSEKGWS